MRTLLSLIVALASIPLIAQVAGQEQANPPQENSPGAPPASADQTPTFRGGVTDVHIDAAVTQGKRLIGGLESSDFIILDEGQPQTIISFGQETVPLDIVLLLDVSGSMRSSIGELADIANDALKHLQPTDRVGVVAFSRDTRVEQDLTTDRQRVVAAIAKAAEGGSIGLGTRINASIADAARFLADQTRLYPQTSNMARKAILIVTDNHPNGAHLSDQEVVKQLFDNDTVLNGIVVHPPAKYRHKGQDPYDVPDRIYFNYENVYFFAQVSGGDVESATTARNSLGEMIARIRSRYGMSYHAPTAEPGTLRRIHVVLSESARRRYPNAVVTARTGYYVRQS